MAPEEDRNVQSKFITITLAVTFMIKILASSQLHRLPLLNSVLRIGIAIECVHISGRGYTG